MIGYNGDYGVTVSSTAITPLTPTVDKTKGQNCRGATIQVTGAAIRFTVDGTTPVGGATGMYLPDGGAVSLTSMEEVSRFQAIRDAGTDATLQATYYRA